MGSITRFFTLHLGSKLSGQRNLVYEASRPTDDAVLCQMLLSWPWWVNIKLWHHGQSRYWGVDKIQAITASTVYVTAHFRAARARVMNLFHPGIHIWGKLHKKSNRSQKWVSRVKRTIPSLWLIYLQFMSGMMDQTNGHSLISCETFSSHVSGE